MRLNIFLVFFFLLSLQFSFSQDFTAFKQKADSCYDIRDLNKALEFYKEALKIKPERILRTEDEVDILFRLSFIYSEYAEYQTALEYCFKALEKDVVKKDPQLSSGIYNRIGVNYNYLEQTDQALKFYKKSTLVKDVDTTKLGAVYNNMANIYQKQNNLDLAREYYKRALVQFEATDHYDGKVAVNMNVGIVELQSHRIETAYNYFKKAEQLSIDKNDTLTLIAVYINFGDYFTEITDYEQAEKYLSWALKYAKESESRMLVMESYKSMVNLYKSQKKYQQAFESLELFKASNDSISKLNSSREYAELEAKYSIREKEKENELLKQQQAFNQSEVQAQEKYISVLLGLVVLALAFVSLFLYQRIKRSKARKQLEAQHREIKKSKKQLEDLNYQYEKLIQKYEGDNSIV
jgi:tetratricopeptide (TPR) repeat protein